MSKRSWIWAALLLVASYYAGQAVAYSSGAPDAACGTMQPGHSGSPQASTSPFSLTPSSVSVEPGQRMLVTLESTTPTDSFMGFIIQARDSDTDQVIGTFFTTDHKYLTCGPGFNNAVTHGGGSQKGKVVLEWEPKSDFQGDIVFKGSFVKDYSTYWTGVTSEKVTVVKREAPTTPPPTSPPTPPTTSSTTTIKTPDTPEPTTTTTTTAAAPTVSPIAEDSSSVSNSTGSIPASPNLDAGILVINEIEGPRLGDDISRVSEGATDVSIPSAPPPAVAPTSSIPPPPPVSTDSSFSSTISNNSIIGTETYTEKVETEAPSSSAAPSSTQASAGDGGRANSGSTKRKGLLGRLRPRPTTPAPPTTTTTTTTRVTSGISTAPIAKGITGAMDNIYFGCESTKGCFGSPNNCVEQENCDYLMTYTKAPAESGYRFEISGDVKGPSGYIAGALSKDGTMGDDSVMICRTEDGITDVLMGWNQGKSNNILSDSNLGIRDEKTAFVDGKVYCSFVRDIETEIFANVFNLDTDKYNIMVASGPTSTGTSISYHSVGRVVSGGQVNLGEFESVESKGNLFPVLHACFMIGAWVFAASVGILLARYFKQTWLRSACCKVDQWFHWHRYFMGLTWLLTMAGFGLIVWHLQGISKIDPTDNPHVVLGFVSTGLCFIQPFMALCRCSPDHRRRPIFNWMHWFVGNSAQIVGITAIFFGLQLWGAPTWTMWLLIIFVAFHCLVHLILSIGQCVSDSKAEHGGANVFPMKDMNGSRNPLHPVDKREDAPGATFRKTMLSFYLIVNMLITAALILVVYPGVDTLKDWGLIFWED